MPTDPVCGMFVSDTSELVSIVDGHSYFFCSKSCQLKYASPEEETKKLKSRLIVGWSLSIPVILITYLVRPDVFAYRDYLLLALAIPIQFYSGLGFYEGAYHSLKSRSANMDLLVSLGTVTAFVFSVFVTFFPEIIPRATVYFDASAFIITLILTGNFIENITKVSANRAASKLIGVIPSISHLITEKEEVVDRKVDEIKPGDRVLIRPGEISAVDGQIFEGKSEVDESMLTGEQEPVLKEPGMELSSGTKNLNGVLKITVSRTGKDSTVSQIYELIQRAVSGRAKIQRVADVFSSVFVPIVIAASLISALFWYIYLNITGDPLSLEIAILAFVSVVVIACPCAIGLAAPITLLISSNLSSENGIIIKNPSSMDRLSKINRVIFDKTGTITEPDPTVNYVRGHEGYTEEDVTAFAASLEQSSNHPIAKAIVAFAREKLIQLYPATEVVEKPGEGIYGNVKDHPIRLTRNHDTIGTSVQLSIDDTVAGEISLSYRIRESSVSAIRDLRAMGIMSTMLTGDSEEAAKKVANEVGIDDIHAEALPGDKADVIMKYQEMGDYVMFVGDGINDSVALETADVGIAMGSGTDIARESGDIILLRNDLKQVISAKIIGDRTISKIKQNIGWAFGYNTILIPVAGGALVPLAGLSVYSYLPILSAFAMGMSSVSVVLNSLLLRRTIHRHLNIAQS